MIGPHTVYLLLPGELGKHGVRGPARRERVDGALVYPRSSTEAQGRDTTVITGVVALLPPGTQVGDDVQIEWNGLTYDVEGDAGVWDFLDGDSACVQVALTKTKD